MNQERPEPSRRGDGWLAAAVLSVGLLGLAGWVFHRVGLLTWARDGVPLMFNTALALIFVSVALFALRAGCEWLAKAAGAVVLVFGAVMVAQIPLGFSLGFDRIFWPGQDIAPALGRVAPTTALALTLTGVMVLLSAQARPRSGLVGVLGGVVFATSLLTLIAYLLGLRSGFSWGEYVGMSLPAAVGLFLCNAALLWRLSGRLGPAGRSMLRSRVSISAAAAIVALVGISAIASNRTQQAVIAWASEAQTFLAASSRLELGLTRLESDLRARLLVGEDRLAGGGMAPEAQVRAELATLQRLASAIPEEAAEIVTLTNLVGQKLDYLREAVSAAERRDRLGAIDIILSGEEAAVMTAIRGHLAQLQERRERQLGLRSAQSTSLAALTNRIILLGNVLALALFTAALVLMNRARRAQAEAQALLEEANRFQRAVLDGTVYAIIATDPEGTVRVFNAGAERMLGYEAGTLVGRASPLLLHDPEEIAAALKSAPAGTSEFDLVVGRAREGGAEEREWTWLCKDGRRLPVRLSVTALRDAGQAVTGFLVLANDLTERNRAMTALLESEERFRSAFDSAGIGMALVDLDGRWLRVNRAICEIVGYSESELVARTIQDITHPEDLSLDTEEIGGLLANRQRYYQIEKRYIDIHGHTVWVRLTMSLVRDAASTPLYFIAQIEDITVQRRYEHAQRESEERMRLFAEHAPASVAMFDRDMTYLVASRQWFVDYRLEGQPVIGRSFYEVFPDLAGMWREVHRRCLAGAVEKAEADLIERADGSRQWLSWEVRPWYRGDGAIGGIVMFTQDITERKQLEENLARARDEAIEASRFKSEFLANMSHEIRTPMNGIIGMASLLMDLPLNADAREMTRIIQNSAESLLSIVNDILDFSKIEAGKLSIDFARLLLGPLVDEVLALLAPKAQAKGLNLRYDFDDALSMPMQGDAGRIRQVLLNLLANAIKFTERGEVAVAVRSRGISAGRVGFRIEIKDTGIGMSRRAQDRLFQPFVQADGTTTRRFGGTGLGLAISRQLVELMGGEIGFESVEGAGSTFWVDLSLPMLAAAPDASPGALPPGLRVLVVDPQPGEARALLDHLAALGATAKAAGGAEEALECLRSPPASGAFQVVLIAAHLPDAEGLDVAGRIRNDPDINPPRLILLAPADSPVPAEALSEARMESALTRPIRMEQLYRALLPSGSRPPFGGSTSPLAVPAAEEVEGPRLLLAEDNLVNQMVARRMLEKLGCRVDVAGNGQLALIALQSTPYDAVLMDCQMPEMDGYEATRRLRAAGRGMLNGTVPVIALTAFAMPGDRMKCLDAGMNDYVTKPVRTDALVDALGRCGVKVRPPRKDGRAP